jgi:hypothetical protein
MNGNGRYARSGEEGLVDTLKRLIRKEAHVLRFVEVAGNRFDGKPVQFGQEREKRTTIIKRADGSVRKTVEASAAKDTAIVALFRRRRRDHRICAGVDRAFGGRPRRPGLKAGGTKLPANVLPQGPSVGRR